MANPEQVGVRYQSPVLELEPNTLENRPEHDPLLLRQTCLPAQPHDVTICLPRVQLPGVNNLLPLHDQEMQAKLVSIDFSRGIFEKLLDQFFGCDIRMTEVQLIEPSPDRIHGVHFQAFGNARFVADQTPQFGS